MFLGNSLRSAKGNRLIRLGENRSQFRPFAESKWRESNGSSGLRQLGRKIPVSNKLKGIERDIKTGWRWTQSRSNFSPA
jgi:hypothetical protein